MNAILNSKISHSFYKMLKWQVLTEKPFNYSRLNKINVIMKSILEFKKLGLSVFNNEEWLLARGSSRSIIGGSTLSTGITASEDADGNIWYSCSDVAKDR